MRLLALAVAIWVVGGVVLAIEIAVGASDLVRGLTSLCFLASGFVIAGAAGVMQATKPTRYPSR